MHHFPVRSLSLLVMNSYPFQSLVNKPWFRRPASQMACRCPQSCTILQKQSSGSLSAPSVKLTRASTYQGHSKDRMAFVMTFIIGQAYQSFSNAGRFQLQVLLFQEHFQRQMSRRNRCKHVKIHVHRNSLRYSFDELPRVHTVNMLTCVHFQCQR